MTRGCVGIYNGLDKRVGGQSVAAVQSSARALAHGIESLDRRLAVGVHLYASAQIVGGGSHGYVVLGDVDAEREALLVYVGEVFLGFLGVLVRDIEIYVFVAVLLHLGVDGSCHNVTRGERESWVILVHELLAALVAQHGSVAAHGLGDEE